MSIKAVLDWLQGTPAAAFMQESDWAFPAVETVHVLALTLVLGTIAMVDLRLLGWRGRAVAITTMTGDLLPWTWGSFVVAALSGSLLFITNAASYYGNLAFRLKMLVLLLAGLNMLVFELRTVRGVAAWNRGQPAPPAARLAGALSLFCWLAIVALGRWVGFTKLPY
jgi:hypothetical protein